MKEETSLDVRCVSLLIDEPDIPGSVYRQLKTYLCEPIKGEAIPGLEPEPQAASHYSIVETKWFDLCSEADWGLLLANDPLTYFPLQNIRKKLGYVDRK